MYFVFVNNNQLGVEKWLLCTKGLFPGSKALLLEMVNKYCTALLCLSLLLSLYLNIKYLRKIVAFQNVILGCGLSHELGRRGF